MDKLDVLTVLKQELARVKRMLEQTGGPYLLGELKGLRTAIVLLERGEG